MNIAEELERLENLKQRGALSEEEYQKAKEALLRQGEPISTKLSSALNQVTTDVNLWSMFIHLSQLCGYLLPLAGLVVPIILWQVKKNDSPLIDQHGRVVTNWIISSLIYYVVAGLLTFVFIGIPLLFVLVLICIVFPIVGGIRANNGEVWQYPMSIKFFPVTKLP
jgi:uncharacterized Tic20 family protein